MKQAAKVNKSVAGLQNNSTLLELSEAITYRTQRFKVIQGVWHYEYKKTPFIAISLGKHYRTRRPETRVFAASAQGEVLSWLSIIPAIEGHADPQQVLEALGFQLLKDEAVKVPQKGAQRRTAKTNMEPVFDGIEKMVGSASYGRKVS